MRWVLFVGLAACATSHATFALALDGDAELEGRPAKTHFVVAPDGWFAETVDLGDVRVERVSGPEGAFAVSVSGSVEPMAASERQSYADRIGRLLGRGLDKATPVGQREKAGTLWNVRRLGQTDLYFDPTDGTLGWAHVEDDAETSWEHLGDWAAVNGQRIPRLEESFDESGKLTSRVIWREVKSVAENQADFARPAGRGMKVTVTSAEAVPFRTVNDKVVVSGTVNGETANVLVDSGAGICLVDKAMAERLGLSKMGSLKLAGTGSESDVPLVGPLTVTIGGVTITGLVAVAFDLVGLEGGKTATPVIVGKELFNNVVVDLDFPARRIAFADSKGYQPRGGTRVPVVFMTGGLIAVELSVEGRPPALFGLDTGGAGALDVFSTYAADNGILDGKKTSIRLAGGIGGTYEEKTARLTTVSFAGATFHDVPTTFPQVAVGAFHTRRLAGNLDAGILSRFRLVFDYARSAVYATVSQPERPLARDRSGIQSQLKDGTLEIVYVAEGSPGHQAGFRKGDRIVSVNGVAVTELDDDARTAWRNQEAGTRVRLGDGKTVREVVLSDYY